MRSLHLLLASSLVLTAACGQVEQAPRNTPTAFATEPDRRLAAMLMPLEKAEKVVVYEGLPHPFYEPELLAEEQQSKEVHKLHGNSFYKEPLKLALDDRKQLQALLSRPDVYEPWEGEKKCGGFHADYCVEWYRDGQFVRALICFGCGEILLAAPNDEQRYDIKYRTFGPAGDILLRYRQQRPDTKHRKYVQTLHRNSKERAVPN